MHKQLIRIGVMAMLAPLTLTAQKKISLNGDLAGYFSSTIEADNLNNPGKVWYDKTVAVSDIAEYRVLLWSEWKKANAERLATWPSIKENTGKDSLVWELPTAKKALFGVVKKGRRPENGYPMYINLHGGGTFPETLTKWASPVNNSEWRAAKFLSMKYADTPSLYFVPRMADDRRGRWYHKGEQTEFLRAWQLGVLSGDVNPDKIYITGISEGGYGSFRMGPFFADYFAGSGPMAGVSYINEAPIENMRNTPFYISVGEFDKAYGRALGGLDWKKHMDSAAIANPGQFINIVDIQKGKGHGIDYFKTTPWLRQFTRNTYPDTLSFKYYAVHDTLSIKNYAASDTLPGKAPESVYTYRKGFGYVRLDGLIPSKQILSDGFLETGARYFYLEKSGNTYHITSDNRVGKVTGAISLYLDKIDFSKPVKVYYEGKLVHDKKVKPNIGVMAESLALFGDPKRIFAAKINIEIDK